jgi:hypothetical protein
MIISEVSPITAERTLTRRTVVQSGVRLAYAAPLITASYGLTPLRAGAADVLSSQKSADDAEEEAKKNSPPVAVAGDGFEVTDTDGDGFELVTLDGSASSDSDGTITSFKWMLKDEVLAREAVADVKLPVGKHTLQLTVTDDKGDSDRAKIRIVVKAGPSLGKKDGQSAKTSDQKAPETTPTPVLPQTPYEVKAKQKNAEVALTWKFDPGPPVVFRIYRTIDDGLNRPVDKLDWVLLFEEPQKLSYRDADVGPGVPYLYVVRSFDGANESEFSKVAAITLDPVEQPTEQPVVEEEPPTEEPAAVEEQPVETEEPTEEIVPTEAPTEVPTEEPPVDEASTDETTAEADS